MIALLFVVLLLAGVPIAYVLGVSALAYLGLADLPLVLIPQRMFLGLNSFILVAVPLFILAGEIMNAAGITRRLIDFASFFVGNKRGGLAYVTVIGCMIISGITGVGSADTAAIGSVMIPAMRRQGYSPAYAAALTACGAIVGPIIPPSVAMVMYGALAEVSIGKLFIAGLVPGALVSLALIAVAAYYARVHNHPVSPPAKPLSPRAAVEAAAALLMPLLIIGGIRGGIFTATEAAGVAVLYALLVGTLLYRELKWQDIVRVFKETALTVGAVLPIVAVAALFGWILASERVPERLAEQVLAITDNRFVVLLLINVLLLFVGMIMETLAAIVILAPVLLPLAANLGIDPIHFGVIIATNLSIGLVTPPVGVNTFIASAISGEPIERVARAALPFLVVSVAVLLLITYVPGISLAVANLWGR